MSVLPFTSLEIICISNLCIAPLFGCPYLVKDINNLEHLSDYKSRLLQLELLPFMYTFELSDIMFFMNPLKLQPPVLTFTTLSHFLPVQHNKALNCITIPPPLISNDTST